MAEHPAGQNGATESPKKKQLRCDYLLIVDQKQRALQTFDAILQAGADPFVLTAKATLQAVLNDRKQAVKTFENALELAVDEGDYLGEITSLVSELEKGGGVLLPLIKQQIAQVGHPIEQALTVIEPSPTVQDADKTEIIAADRTVPVGPRSKSLLAEFVSDYIRLTESRPSSPTGQADSKNAAGESFGRYKIVEKLGEGGMGAVYKAHDPEMGRTVALKVVKGEGVSNAKLSQRFLQEVKATARLRHPNIVAIYDFGEQPQHYFTMEYVSGKSLSDEIREGIFKSKKAALFLKSVCEAIACAHDAKIIHRDLKPGNIMIDKKNGIKVMDFGLAKFLEDETAISHSGDIIGTPTYMSPEQAAGKHVDERSDIYAIGAIGYEMITGKPVFQGPTVLAILQQVSHRDPIRPRAVNAGIAPDLETILLKCLEKSPDKRYQNARELAEELDRYLQDRPIVARPPTLSMRLGKWIKRNKEFSSAAAVIVLSIVGVFVYVTWQWREQYRHNQALNILREVMQWNKSLVSYEKEVRPQFEKASRLSNRDIIYQNWGLFCFQYAQAQLHKGGTYCQHLQERDIYYREAMDKFEKAFALNADDYASLYYMIFIHYVWQHNRQAYDYEKLLSSIIKRLNPESGLKYQTLAVELLNKSYTLPLGEKEAMQNLAFEHYQQAIRYDPLLPCSHNGLGIIYRERKQYALAKEALDRCIQLTPTYRYAYVNRARMHFLWAMECLHNNDSGGETAHLADARRDFKQAIDLDPDGDIYYQQVTAGDVYYELARVCGHQNDDEQALQNLRLAVQHRYSLTAAAQQEPAFAALKEREEFVALFKK